MHNASVFNKQLFSFFALNSKNILANLSIFIDKYKIWCYNTIVICQIGEENMKTLGERISFLMKEKHITQKDLALMVGVTESALSRYVSNERQPKIEVLANLATALDTTVDFLTTGKQVETTFDEIYRLVARSSYTLNEAQKMKIIEAVMKNK